MAKNQAAGADEHGRIAPQLLAGGGADKFIADNDLKTTDLISSKAIKSRDTSFFYLKKSKNNFRNIEDSYTTEIIANTSFDKI